MNTIKCTPSLTLSLICTTQLHELSEDVFAQLLKDFALEFAATTNFQAVMVQIAIMNLAAIRGWAIAEANGQVLDKHLVSRKNGAHREFWRAISQIQRQLREQARAAKEAAKEEAKAQTKQPEPEPEPPPAVVETEQNESKEAEVNTSVASESSHITQDNQSEPEKRPSGRQEDRPKNPERVLREQRKRERKARRVARRRSRAAR